MVLIRCTRKILERLRPSALAGDQQSTTLLGDWYVDFLPVGRHRLVLAVSQPSLLSLVIPARDLKNLDVHLRSSLDILLSSLGVPPDIREGELHEMKKVAYARTASRVVLGCMLDLAFRARVRVESGQPYNLNELALELSTNILSPLGHHRPRDVALALLSHQKAAVQ